MCYTIDVRVVLAILLGLLLAGANVFSGAARDPFMAQDAPSCSCVKCTCLCDVPDSAPIPITPIPTPPQQEARSLAVMQVLFELSFPSLNQFFPQLSLSASSPSAVPVYQRNCTFLI